MFCVNVRLNPGPALNLIYILHKGIDKHNFICYNIDKKKGEDNMKLYEVKWFNYKEPLTGNEEVYTSIITEEEYQKMRANPKIAFTNIKLAGT